MKRPDRIESIIQILILLVIGCMAGAASFTHVHDWTMHYSPKNTSDWFGWANAVISELTPTAAGLEIRRRKRHHQSITYPMAVLIAAAILSLTAQVSEAKAGTTGWLVAAVPALAFLALSKLVLSRTSTQPEPDTEPAPADIPDPIVPATAPDLAITIEDTPPATTTAPVLPAPEPAEELPSYLINGARMATFAHRQATGQTITAPALADHLGITPTLATNLLHALGETGEPADTPAPITHVNGTPVEGRL